MASSSERLFSDFKFNSKRFQEIFISLLLNFSQIMGKFTWGNLSSKSIEEGYRQKKRQRSSLLFVEKNLFNSFPALAILPRTILKNRMNSSFSFKSSWCNSSYNSNRLVQNSKRGKELIKFIHQAEATLLFLLSLYFFYSHSKMQPTVTNVL